MFKRWSPSRGAAPAAAGNLDFEARVPVPLSLFPSTFKNNAEEGVDRQKERIEIERSEVDIGRRVEEEHSFNKEKDFLIQKETETVETYPGRASRSDHIEVDINSDRHHHRNRHVRHPELEVEIESRKMGYYDDEGRYHSLRRGIEKATDRVFHPFHPHHEREREEIVIERERRDRRDDSPHQHTRVYESDVRYVDRGHRHHHHHHHIRTITIPCHHIRLGDLLVLQGRPCQVIRISTSAQTGQYRYVGVDLFTKDLQEESSFVSNPAPSVIVQNMLGPVFKTYRVLDIHHHVDEENYGTIVAMTETGDIKQHLPVLEQGGLWQRLHECWAQSRGSVRVMVINDGGRELAVDYKVMHSSRL